MAPPPEARPRLVGHVHNILKEEVARYVKKYADVDPRLVVRIKLLDNLELAKYLASTPYDEVVVETIISIVMILQTQRCYFVIFNTFCDADNDGAVTCQVTGYFSTKDLKEENHMFFTLVPLAARTARWAEILNSPHPLLKDTSFRR